jgi:hypothetical protein
VGHQTAWEAKLGFPWCTLISFYIVQAGNLLSCPQISAKVSVSRYDTSCNPVSSKNRESEPFWVRSLELQLIRSTNFLFRRHQWSHQRVRGVVARYRKSIRSITDLLGVIRGSWVGFCLPKNHKLSVISLPLRLLSVSRWKHISSCFSVVVDSYVLHSVPMLLRYNLMIILLNLFS